MRLSEHAVKRYIERVKPALTMSQAFDELSALVAQAKEVKEVPWLTDTGKADAILELCDGIVITACFTRCPRCDGTGGSADMACPKCGGVGTTEYLVASTILVRGGSSPERREKRNKNRAEKRAHRRFKASAVAPTNRPRQKRYPTD